METENETGVIDACHTTGRYFPSIMLLITQVQLTLGAHNEGGAPNGIISDAMSGIQIPWAADLGA